MSDQGHSLGPISSKLPPVCFSDYPAFYKISILFRSDFPLMGETITMAAKVDFHRRGLGGP